MYTLIVLYHSYLHSPKCDYTTVLYKGCLKSNETTDTILYLKHSNAFV